MSSNADKSFFLTHRHNTYSNNRIGSLNNSFSTSKMLFKDELQDYDGSVLPNLSRTEIVTTYSCGPRNIRRRPNFQNLNLRATEPIK